MTPEMETISQISNTFTKNQLIFLIIFSPSSEQGAQLKTISFVFCIRSPSCEISLSLTTFCAKPKSNFKIQNDKYAQAQRILYRKFQLCLKKASPIRIVRIALKATKAAKRFISAFKFDLNCYCFASVPSLLLALALFLCSYLTIIRTKCWVHLREISSQLQRYT